MFLGSRLQGGVVPYRHAATSRVLKTVQGHWVWNSTIGNHEIRAYCDACLLVSLRVITLTVARTAEEGYRK